MKWGILGSLVVEAAEGESRNVDVAIGGVNFDGTTNAVGRAVKSKVELQDADEEQIETFYIEEEGQTRESPFINLAYGKFKSTVKINSTEKEQRIIDRQKKWARGPHEPAAQAHYINKALQEGLRGSIKESLISHRKHERIILLSVFCTSFGLASAMSLPISQAITGGGEAALPLGLSTAYGLRSVVWATSALIAQESNDLTMSDRHHSLVPGFPLDRYLMARMNVGRTLVKAID